MTRERWNRIKDIVGTVLDSEPQHRPALLERACGGDTTLQAEVETILQNEGLSGMTTAAATPKQKLAWGLLPQGKVLSSRFEIIRFIGQGGMGDVYEAEDRVVGGRIAVKTLRREIAPEPRVLARFRQEVQQARKVTHPNVCRIFDLAIHTEEDGEEINYLTMELLEGETLAQRLRSRHRMTTGEALPIVRQIADALGAAHSAGVIHRDLKSANVMLVRDATGAEAVKVMDFGLARATNGAESGTSMRGGLVGTPAYMAPEQVEGKTVTPAADIYAFGIMAYELVTGALPFTGENTVAIAIRRLQELPPPPRLHVPDLDPNWERGILACLERDPVLRPATAREFVAIVAGKQSVIPRTRRRLWLAGVAAAFVLVTATYAVLDREALFGGLFSSKAISEAKPVIAVLRFENKSDEPDSEYFSDGMTEEVIAALTKVSGIEVLARNTAFSIKPTEQGIRDAGQRLGVNYVLTGVVQRANRRLRLIATLYRVSDFRNVWSETFNRDTSDIFVIQDDIANSIVRQVRGRFPAQTPPKRNTENIEAFNLYLNGRYHWNKRVPESFRRALDYFQQAIAADPNYALAYSGLADTYSTMLDQGILRPDEAIAKARSAADSALRLDPNLAEAHASAGLIASLDIRNFAEAEGAFRRAIDLNPNYASAHQWYAVYLVKNGRMGEAQREYRVAQQMDPLSFPVQKGVAYYLLYNRKPDELLKQVSRLVEIDAADVTVRTLRAAAYSLQGRNEEARQHLAPNVSNPDTLTWMAHFNARTGRKEEALQSAAELKRLRGTQPILACRIGMVYASLGMNSEAMDWLEKAYEERDQLVMHVNLLPFFDGLVSDPRFEALRKRLGVAFTVERRRGSEKIRPASYSPSPNAGAYRTVSDYRTSR